MFKSIFGSAHLTSKWERDKRLVPRIELFPATINGVPMGNAFTKLQSFGSTQSKHKNLAEYYDLGLSFDLEKDDSFKSLTVHFHDAGNDFQQYSGELTCRGALLDHQNLTRETLNNTFGEPYWIDEDDEEAVLFFEYPDLELQIECDLSGQVKAIIVTQETLMGNAQQRESYGVTKAWPPY